MKNKMMKLIISLVLALCLILAFAAPVFATNPTVTMTVTAGIVSITNTKSSWALGTATVSEVIYFSTNGAQDDDWSQIENTGSLTVDVEIQGTDFEGGDYDWTLGAASGNQTYSLYANKAATPTVYDVEVKSSGYNDITAVAGLAPAATNDWSMKFIAPNEFNAADDLSQKSATVTLVASEHT